MSQASTEADSAPVALSQQLPEVIEGPRLRLEIWHPDHAEMLSAAVENSLEELRRWMPWTELEPLSLDDRRKLMADGRARWQGEAGAHGDGSYGMWLDARIVGACGLHTRQGPGILEIGYWVDSSHVGQGLATEAVQMLTKVALAHPDVSSVEIRHDGANLASGAVAEKAGFLFAAQTTAPPEAPAESGVDITRRYMTLPGFQVRAEQPADYGAIAEVVEAAFGTPVEPRLVEDIRSSPEYVPEMALVAESEGNVIGHVMISGCLLRREGTDTPIVMLSPLAVAPDFHGRGVGAALVSAVVELAEERGEPMVILEGNPAYYSRFGFEPSTDYGLTLPLPDWAPIEAGQVRRLSNYDSSLTGTVVYPKAFEGLD